MAIGYLNVAIIGRSQGRSAVGAAAYASRADLIDDRTGTAYRYARKSGDLVTSFVWLPKGAPEHLRDRATLWNEVEKAETKKNSQVARRIIMALPHELTAKQQEQLLQDFIKENFTRKGLAVDASIHQPDRSGDERNHHAHLLIPTRFMDKNGLGKKDRVSNDQATGLEAWKESWVKLANRQLERYGHAARITFEVAEGQTAQNHMGPEATALERQGVETRAGDDRLEIITDNMQPAANDNRPRTQLQNDFTAATAPAMPGIVSPDTARRSAPANDNDPSRAVGKEALQEVAAQPETIDRDAQTAEWQDSIDNAAIAYADEQRRQFLQAQAAERATFERHGQDMTARHARAWHEVAERHQAGPTAYQPGTAAEAEQAISGGFSFFLSLFTSIAESVTRSLTNSHGRPARSASPDKGKQRQDDRRQEQQRQQQAQEMEAMQAEQARETASFERRREAMLFEQGKARAYYDAQAAERSSLQQAFDLHTSFADSSREALTDMAARKDAQQERGRDGPELGG